MDKKRVTVITVHPNNTSSNILNTYRGETDDEMGLKDHLKSQGWEYTGHIYRSDSDAFSHSANEVEKCVNKGKTKVIFLVFDSDTVFSFIK